MRAPDRPGVSLVELIFALIVMAVLLGLAMPPLHRAVDVVASETARDALAAYLGRTRLAAVAAGGALLVLNPATGTARIEVVRGASPPPLRLAGDYGVRMSMDGSAGRPVVLRFDGLGLGQIASRTIRLRRGAAEAGLTISSYGRARRW